MTDDDLIRRGDALKALNWGDIYGRNAQQAIRALPAVTLPDVAKVVEEAGKVLEGVTPGPWYWEENHPTNACANVMAKSEAGWSFYIATLYGNTDDVPAPTMPDEPWGDHPIRRATARFIAWCREGVPALISLATAQAAQIAGLEDAIDQNWITHQRVVAAETALAAERAKTARLVEALGVVYQITNDGDVQHIARAALSTTTEESREQRL